MAQTNVTLFNCHPGLGSAMLTTLNTRTPLVRYGECWKTAVRDLEAGCKKLTDDEQSFLALQFANCFLEKSGQQTYPCPRGKKVKSPTSFTQSDSTHAKKCPKIPLWFPYEVMLILGVIQERHFGV